MMKRIAAVMVALLCVALVLGALGCGNKDSEGKGGGSGSPEQVVKDFWAAMKAGNLQKAKTFMTAELAEEAFEGMEMLDESMMATMFKAITELMDLKVKGSTIDGDEATVDVVISMPDMEAIDEEAMMELFFGLGMDLENMSEAQMAEAFAKKLPELLKKAPTVTKDEKIDMAKEGGAWKIASSPLEDLEGL